MNNSLRRVASSADITLLLEGTFPYVAGGVSAWVNQLLLAFPDVSFAVIFIGGRREDYGKPRFELPDNVVHFEEHFIHELSTSEPSKKSLMGDPTAFKQMETMHEALHEKQDLKVIGELMRSVIPLIEEGGAINEQAFLHSQCAWQQITKSYEKYCSDPSFTDYFWTVRIMHKPLWQLARIASTLPKTRIYHTISTGYAGFLGALLHFRTSRPLLVTEHGIYTKERKIDLLQSQWIKDNRSTLERDLSQVSYFQNLWMRFFSSLGRICYEAADEIVSLYEGNRLRQISDGAPEAKTRCIPNGINISRFVKLKDQRPEQTPLVIALIGRVVPIKDIKTFIRSAFIARSQIPSLQIWIVGPDSEDPDYARECIDLVHSLNLQNELKFLGFKKIEDILPQVGLVVLSSISEALPLVILEAFAAGVPVVSTDVGACRELIEGSTQEDKALGKAGSVVPIANPEQLASAMIELLHDQQAWDKAQQAAVTRVERYYTDTLMEDSYRLLYQGLFKD